MLASGSIVTVSPTSHSDLWWGLRGAGHNFGIVTQFTLKIHDYPASHWYVATFAFTQDKLEAVVTQINKMMGNGTQPRELMNSLEYAWNPAISTTEVSGSSMIQLFNAKQRSNLEFFRVIFSSQFLNS